MASLEVLAHGGPVMGLNTQPWFLSHGIFSEEKSFIFSRESDVTPVIYIKLAFWIKPVWLVDNTSSCSFDDRMHSLKT